MPKMFGTISMVNGPSPLKPVKTPFAGKRAPARYKNLVITRTEWKRHSCAKGYEIVVGNGSSKLIFNTKANKLFQIKTKFWNKLEEDVEKKLKLNTE